MTDLTEHESLVLDFAVKLALAHKDAARRELYVRERMSGDDFQDAVLVGEVVAALCGLVDDLIETHPSGAQVLQNLQNHSDANDIRQLSAQLEGPDA